VGITPPPINSKKKEKVMMLVISPAGLFRVRRKGKKKQMSLLVSFLLP
jgi:hypothetical protein